VFSNAILDRQANTVSKFLFGTYKLRAHGIVTQQYMLFTYSVIMLQILHIWQPTVLSCWNCWKCNR